MSMKPGVRTAPAASTTRRAAPPTAPTSTTRPPRTPTSPSRAGAPVPSTICAPRMTRSSIGSPPLRVVIVVVGQQLLQLPPLHLHAPLRGSQRVAHERDRARAVDDRDERADRDQAQGRE